MRTQRSFSEICFSWRFIKLMKTRTPTFFVILAVLLIGGTILRVSSLDRQSLWNDEVYSMHNIQLPWHEAFYQPVNDHPPLYFAQLRVWSWLVQPSFQTLTGLIKLRANSALWGLLSLILLFLLALRYMEPWQALVGLAFAVFSPFHLAYCQDLRPYTLALAEATAGFLVMEALLKQGAKLKTAGGLIALWTAQLYTHYWGIFVTAAQATYGTWKGGKCRHSLFILLGSLIVAGILFLFWLPVLKFHLEETAAQNYELPRSNPILLGKTFLAFTGVFFQFANQEFRSPGHLAWNASVATVFALALVLGLWRGPSAIRLWLLIVIGTPFLISYWHPIYMWYRYPFLSYSAFTILVASGIGTLRKRWLQSVLVAVVLVSELLGCYSYFTSWQKANAKPAVSYACSLKTTDSVIVRPAYFSELYSFYDNGLRVPIIDQHMLDDEDKRAELKGKKVIFMAFHVPDDEVGAALITDFRVVSARSFPSPIRLHGITIYELR
jgi:hypothetical protein